MTANVAHSRPRLGSRPTRRVASGLVAAGATTAIVLAGAAQPADAATATPAVTCDYQLRTWPTGFMANIVIANAGPTIRGWTVRWTFDSPSKVTTVWSANITDGPTGVVATNVSYNAVIPSGSSTTFGWNALAETTSVPDDLTINGQPC